jgi:hypothetical protein
MSLSAARVSKAPLEGRILVSENRETAGTLSLRESAHMPVVGTVGSDGRLSRGEEKT